MYRILIFEPDNKKGLPLIFHLLLVLLSDVDKIMNSVKGLFNNKSLVLNPHSYFHSITNTSKVLKQNVVEWPSGLRIQSLRSRQFESRLHHYPYYFTSFKLDKKHRATSSRH